MPTSLSVDVPRAGSRPATTLPRPSERPRKALLALDLGTHTGWALRHRDGTTTSGTEHFQPRRFEGGGMRFWLTHLGHCMNTTTQ